MRCYPDDESDREDLVRLNAQDWQVEQLRLNPEYVHWGPREDYMWVKTKEEGGSGGWNARILLDDWATFHGGKRDADGELVEGGLELDDLNECVNFYFALDRDAKDCETCGGRGSHPDAQWVTESWYDMSSPFSPPDPYSEQIKKGMNDMFGSGLKDGIHGRNGFPDEATLAKYGPEFRAFCERMRDGDGSWRSEITQDEVDALIESGRLRDLTHKHKGWNEETKRHDYERIREDAEVTPELVNDWAKGGIGHDAINQWVCAKARLKRYGLPKDCPTCEGHAQLFTEPTARLTLTLWWLHPRKGCSRGIEVKRIKREDLPAVYAFLKEAADRNAERFAKVVELAQGAVVAAGKE